MRFNVKRFTYLSVGALVLAAGVAAVFAGNRNDVGSRPESTESSWSVVDGGELGFTFEHPGTARSEIDRYEGDTGHGFRGTVPYITCTQARCEESTIRFGGISVDFSAARSRAELESDAFTLEGGAYFLQHPNGAKQPIRRTVRRIDGRNTEGILLTGSTSEGMLTVSATERQAIFNLPHTRYRAVSFIWNSEEVRDEDVEAIINMFTVTEPE